MINDQQVMNCKAVKFYGVTPNITPIGINHLIKVCVRVEMIPRERIPGEVRLRYDQLLYSTNAFHMRELFLEERQLVTVWLRYSNLAGYAFSGDFAFGAALVAISAYDKE